MTNDAHGKAPTFEEQVSKFQGFSVKDGEVDKGEATAEEKAALASNSRTHAENLRHNAAAEKKTPAAGEKAPAAADKTPVELTDEESEAAIAAAQEAAGEEELDDKAKEEAVAAALAEKTKAKEQRDRTYRGRIRAQTSAQRQAERERDEARADAAALRIRLQEKTGGKADALTEKAKSERTPLAGKPDHTDTAKYEYGELDPKYLADLTRWTVLDANDEVKHNEKSTEVSTADAEAAAAFKERVAAFEEAGLDEFGDDFEPVITALKLPKDDPDFWPLSPELGELLLESAQGPAIAKELASDPKEARRIFKLPLLRQGAWFVAKETELLAGSGASNGAVEEGDGAAARQPGPKSPKAQESKAPLPLPSARKLTGAGGNRVPNEATTDFAAFEAMARGRSN